MSSIENHNVSYYTYKRTIKENELVRRLSIFFTKREIYKKIEEMIKEGFIEREGICISGGCLSLENKIKKLPPSTVKMLSVAKKRYGVVIPRKA